MNDELKNKNSKIKVIYVRSNDNSNRYTQNTYINRSKGYSYFSRTNDNYLPVYDNKKFRSDNQKCGDYKRKNALEKFDHSGIINKSFIDPTILRRQRAEETRVYGDNACYALFQSRPNCIIRAWFIQSATPRFKEALRWMAANRKAYHVVDDTEITKVSGTEHHGGVCFLIKKRNGTTVQQWVSQVDAGDCVLALEDVRNPHNLGAIIRSCAHFGVKGILLQDAALLESGAAIRTAEGGAEHVQPITSNSIINALKEFRKAGYTIVITSSHSGVPLFKTILPRKMVLVLGQERNGLSVATLSIAGLSICINGTGNIESLNVSVATGVLLGEWWRQNKA